MRYFYLCVSTLLFACLLQAAESEFRTFTDPQGREMRAKLTLVSGDDVFIERQDGLATKVDISIFGQEDQEFIRAWEKLAAFKNNVDVRFRTHITDRSSFEGSGGVLSRRWQEGYEIVLTNKSAFDMTDVRIEYLVLKFEDAIAAERRSEGEIRKIKGKTEVADIPARSDGNTTTGQFPMLETKLAPGYSWASGGKRTSKDKMEGVWIKVYQGENLVAEVSRPENLDRRISWD
ncbi:MAG: hypothetical protein EA353_10465 [Puniceicoccaceae bacterium]|nr:MAG: hypothetical protein EA353_10465 [Puniceicoccaceae bacterium]